MRTITLLVVHCSATKAGLDYTVEDIDAWHRQRGFQSIGYHYVIYRDGSIHAGRDEAKVGAHCKNHNAHSIGICYIGGLDSNGRPADTRTPAQKASLNRLLHQLHDAYPHALILGHHDLNPQKACPCFNAASEYLSITEDTEDQPPTIRSDIIPPADTISTQSPIPITPTPQSFPILPMTHLLILLVAILLLLHLTRTRNPH